ncbi:MAG: ribbon-helix-helix domain-containing protein [Spirochaetaceae bacterium]|nr:ribbon-helix-helix domain-containing protein [Spirochaetaceae bacterium]
MPNKIAGYRKRDGKSRDTWYPEPPRTAKVLVKLSPDEKQAWKRAAVLEGRSLSELIRHAVNDYARQAAPLAVAAAPGGCSSGPECSIRVSMIAREWYVLEALGDGQSATLDTIEDRVTAASKGCVPADQVSWALSQAKGAGNVHHDEERETWKLTEDGCRIIRRETDATDPRPPECRPTSDVYNMYCH